MSADLSAVFLSAGRLPEADAAALRVPQTQPWD